jgi:hypothetical protein
MSRRARNPMIQIESSVGLFAGSKMICRLGRKIELAVNRIGIVEGATQPDLIRNESLHDASQ